MEKKFVSLPYIYPVCPLSIDHARMFVIADILARYARLKGSDVVFPVASHYSGNTAQKIAEFFCDAGSESEPDAEQEKKRALYRDFYSTPEYILKKFSDPLFILDYFSQEILWELRLLGISCDYDKYYTTKNERFSEFVREIISRYKDEKLLVKNKSGEVALDYDNEEWKNNTRHLLEQTEFIHPSQKKIIESTLKNNNVRNDWGILRDGGFGVEYEGHVVDPMFDSELFTVFDLYMAYHDEPELKEFDNDGIFAAIFNRLLSGGEHSNNPLVERVVASLPCDVFVCEEHLKNWVLKRMYAESYFMDKSYRTKSYFVTGMGLLNGKRMSASRGCAILTKDLIRDHGPWKARLIMLLTGGHPSKVYQFDERIPEQASEMIEHFSSYMLQLLSIAKRTEENVAREKTELSEVSAKIEGYIEKGYFKQAVIELITIIPKKYKTPDKKASLELLDIYGNYLELFLPGFLRNFNL